MKKLGLSVIPLVLIAGLTFQNTPWVAPIEASAIKNPVAKTEKSVLTGKKIYQSYCSSCHGATGKGDGPAGVNLQPKPANLASDAFQLQSDGAIFWKLSEGRGLMAPFKHSLTTEQRWHLVNLMRSIP